MAHPTGGYKNKEGKKVPGTTTIIGRFKETGGLLWWACEQGKAIERGEIDNLYDKRDEAADAGTLAHSLVEAHINGDQLPEVVLDSDVGMQALKGYNNYKRWERDNNITIIEQEMELISEIYQYGGCPDAIGKDSEGNLCLIDWKTSNGVYTDYLIQLAAYRNLWEENYPDRPLTGGFHLMRFSKEYGDFAHHYWDELDDAWEQFKLLRQAFDIDKKLKRRVK